MLEVSAIAADMFVDRGFTATNVADIAAAAGVSSRTFHRYFDAKEDAVVPFLEEGWKSYVAAVDHRPVDESLLESLIHALDGSFRSVSASSYRDLIAILPDSAPLQRVWLQIHEDCQQAMQPVITRRLALTGQNLRARFVAACIVAANRIAAEMWASDPTTSSRETVEKCLSMIEIAVLEPSPITSNGEPRETARRKSGAHHRSGAWTGASRSTDVGRGGC
ncbi:TetR family transcriptional regulator [Rhodococcus sp. BP-349]|uniref:TetR family transcriptional regulator n=1 Tax=unclassified Rhodococcus (in: high G+C Gram-positive bacteria) TaxID=192944 RepID=UPI001C9A35DB|nr:MULTISPECIES: TetR family transcriptional regulator [unclassified Rhodococcus (in: high G+C Gram-positive bacteria)]MBY6537754.1 TetR family transcriptional regulator [Rhodococcus sp. BP-363]MBY6542091.1 TetR family transcriptional regulator [Rhodococcus sp. BP-369]MBY6561321.1 TetR family transcriptional regulator [Rhodococcus sp. BP-370]MBY6575613.1 TetR family transcriptional regulator [Rhodococcus sp. BP-364]MBY6584914.1 TetR family transcriptional regulator [Rhodococcus sp. BP-358]